MKKSSYKSLIHLYSICFIILTVIVSISFSMIIYVVSTVKPDGQTVLNKWPINFTKSFAQYIVFTNAQPQVSNTGLELLDKDSLWLQIIDESGHEVLSFNKPSSVTEQYSAIELLELYKSGSSSDYTPFIESVHANGEEWTYIIGFPVQISKITMYVDANRFTSGRPIIIVLLMVATFVALVLGGIYGFWTTRQLLKIAKAVGHIALRTYDDTKNKGVFGDVYDSLNTLYSEIRTSDEQKKKTEIMREEWIANITHDLKTPLSPIKGYTELLAENHLSFEDVKRYSNIILKNTAYAEALVNDLKLTYQLKNNMVPKKRKDKNITRFLKESIIDVLNSPSYAERQIYFDGQDIPIIYSIDPTLMKRAFNNLFYNALAHNPPETEIIVSLIEDEDIYIYIQDNGKGMNLDEINRLFERYYRGTSTDESTEGTGLGMAIAKQIIELHGGSICVESTLGNGTMVTIRFPFSN